jgi:N-formylglutamate deformylase
VITVLWPDVAPVPVVACVPHGGLDYPEDLAADLVVNPRVLWGDWLTRELYDFLPELGIATVTTSFSRFVADVNRNPDGVQHGPLRMSVVADSFGSAGRPIYRRRLTADDIRYRIRLAHEPFHQALDEVVAERLGDFSRILLLDLHSFGVRMDGDIIIGDRNGQSARPLITGLVASAFVSTGLDVRLNQRYTGGWTVGRFARHDRVDAIQVELNQRSYLNFDGHNMSEPPPKGAFDRIKGLLRTAVLDIRDHASWVTSTEG